MIHINNHLSKHLFSTLSELINQRVPLIDPNTGDKLDHHLNRYHSPIYSAYLYKRRLKRSQIYPKIHIIDDVPTQQQPHLDCQTLFPIKKYYQSQQSPMDEFTMQRLVKEDPSNINSSYIISVFCEDHFKPLIDEYVRKVLVCGKIPNDYDKMNQIEQRVKELYRTFYYGEPVTPLERQLQLKYLSEKQGKYIDHTTIFRDGKQNDFTRCRWREQDQRVLEDLANWRRTDPENDDTNFRPFFQPLQLIQRCSTVQRLYQHLGVQNWYDRRQFNKEIKVYYEISEKYYSLVADKIYNRINKFINSVQFTNLLKIPPDFMIQMAMYQIHIWLVCERLLAINTRESRYLSNLIMENFKSRLEHSASSLNIKKQNILLRNLHKMIWQNSGVLRFHFGASSITKDNPYKGIDALVWSILFFQKVNRYGDQVYLMGEYLIKNYQMIQNYTQEDFFNGIVEFDAYLVDAKYKLKIQSINPPLSKQQFQKEFDSDSLQKKYHYNEIQKGFQVPIDQIKKQPIDTKISWFQIISPILNRFNKKYKTMDTMDHYDGIEQQEKKQKTKQEKTLWKSKIDQIKDTEEEFKQIKNIKKQIHSQSKRNIWSNLKTNQNENLNSNDLQKKNK